MDTIIVACDTPDRRLLHQLAGLLHSYCTPAVTDSEEIQIAEHADLLLCRAENNCQIDGAGLAAENTAEYAGADLGDLRQQEREKQNQKM